VIKSPARWGIPLRPLPRSHGERVLVVGDAAGQVKPTTGGGIYYSLVASDVAAETLRTALIEDNLSASSLSYYEKSWRSALSKELEVGYSARRIFEGLRGCFQSVS
jgi:digeranylgeranylglycerophospholipid reductase